MQHGVILVGEQRQRMVYRSFVGEDRRRLRASGQSTADISGKQQRIRNRRSVSVERSLRRGDPTGRAQRWRGSAVRGSEFLRRPVKRSGLQREGRTSVQPEGRGVLRNVRPLQIEQSWMPRCLGGVLATLVTSRQQARQSRQHRKQSMAEGHMGVSRVLP